MKTETPDTILENLIAYGAPASDLAICSCCMVWSPDGSPWRETILRSCPDCEKSPVHVLTADGDAITFEEYLARELH